MTGFVNPLFVVASINDGEWLSVHVKKKKKKRWTLPYLNDNYVAVGCLDTNHVKSLGVSEVAAETRIPFVTVSRDVRSIRRTKLPPH